MANYANQKRVINIKDEVERTRPQKGKQDSFCYCSWKTISKAGKMLSGNGFKLYMYFLSWTGEETFFFSKAHAIELFGFGGMKAVSLAIEDMKRNGFLTEENNTYYFHPTGLNPQ